MEKSEWGIELQDIGKRYHIRKSTKMEDKGARRIAILVSESFLRDFSNTVPAARFGGFVNMAGFIQSDVYRQAKQLNLSCAEIEEEERIREMGAKGRGFDPLKLHPDTDEHNPGLMEFIFDNLLKYQKGAKNDNLKRAINRSIAR